MLLNYKLLLAGLALLPSIFGSPLEERAANTLPNMFTLTAYAPKNREYNGLKVENLQLFKEKVSQYCPDSVREAGGCPNGTDMAFAGTLYPLSLVPGGQDLYVNNDGLISITVQHSHSIPPDAYPNYVGWTWTPLSKPNSYQQRYVVGCPRRNKMYNCKQPGGFWSFKAPSAKKGGVMACPSPWGGSTRPDTLYAVTPNFTRTAECVSLLGLGTHNYTGGIPVWAY